MTGPKKVNTPERMGRRTGPWCGGRGGGREEDPAEQASPWTPPAGAAGSADSVGAPASLL